MKSLIIAIIFTISGTFLAAQYDEAHSPERAVNNLHLNFLGEGSIMSLSYERLDLINTNFFLAGKIGVGVNSNINICIGAEPCPPNETYLTIPCHITGNLGKGKHHFEFGIGGVSVFRGINNGYHLYPIIGYRLQPIESKRFSFRFFGAIPFSGYPIEGNYVPPALGVSFGSSF